MAGSLNRPLRWGIASTGKISHDFTSCLHYLRTKRSVPLDVVAVAARSRSASEGFAREFGLPRAHEGYAALLGDPAVDVVYIGAVNPAHKALAIEAARRGKHVVCEKPLAMSLGDVLEIQDAARESGVFLLEGLWTKFIPLVKRLRRMILEEGVIGDVKCIQSDFGVDVPRDARRFWSLEMGGGALLDLGIYPVAYIPWLFGAHAAPESYKVEGGLDPATGVDAFGAFSATYAGGRLAIASWSGLCLTPEEVVVTGTAGYVRVHGPAHCPTRATVCIRRGRGFEEQVIEEAFPDFGPGYRFNYPNSEGLIFEILAAHEAISGGLRECAEHSWADSRRVCEILDACRAALGVVYPQGEAAS